MMVSLKFEIISSRTVEEDGEKKFVAYMLQVRQDITKLDSEPAHVERRYTDFLNLYNGLKKDYAPLMNEISFPRKIMVGNFDAGLISARCWAFEGFLNHIANESRLRESPAVVAFFQDKELSEARMLQSELQYEKAFNLFESSFKLLNKLYTDRSRIVLCALCRLVACATHGAMLGYPIAGRAEKWAQLALKRYEAVSDSDLLVLYIPLLQACEVLWDSLEKDTKNLLQELEDLKKRGMKVESDTQCPMRTLEQALEKLETAI